jgi:hypothetical protein
METSENRSNRHKTLVNISLVPRRFGLFTSLSARGKAREGEKWKIRREAPHNEIDQIDPRGPRKGHASHRTAHSAWVRG